MMKIYYLSTCSTCKRFLASLQHPEKFALKEIKSTPLTEADVEEMRAYAGSYDALFSRRAIQYRIMKLSEKDLNESDIKDLILSEYTFLKRPVTIIGNRVFTGASDKNVNTINRMTSD